MKLNPTAVICLSLLLLSVPLQSCAGFFDNLSREIGFGGGTAKPASGLSDATIVKGLKEALSTGTVKAVKSVSQPNGYFNNDMIKILMPEKVRGAADLLARFGFRQQVDDFVLSMNRAAEKAAPKASEYFVTALKEMTFDDARKILQGGNTSATEYFKQKTGDKIQTAFKPVIAESMKDVGVASKYNQMTDSFRSIPFAGEVGSLDLNQYITTKAVDGLFTMLGEEEKKIRTDPAARATDLLKKVFGK